MGSYRIVNNTFWTDPKVEDDFTPEDKYFFLYLLTNMHTNLCGCYEISKKQMSKETGYNVEVIDNLIYRFKSIHKVIDYDEATKELLVINWHKYNWSDSEKLIKGVENLLDYIENVSFRTYVKDVLEAHRSRSKSYPIYRVSYGIDTVSYPMDTSVSVSVSDKDNVDSNSNSINIQESKEITECARTIQESVSADDATAKGVVRADSEETAKKRSEIDHAFDEPFETFWQAFPRRRRGSKQECRKKYERAIKNNKGLTPEKMLEALEAQKRSMDWQKQNGEYVPAPLTWLNNGRWEDEVYDPATDNANSNQHVYEMTDEIKELNI